MSWIKYRNITFLIICFFTRFCEGPVIDLNVTNDLFSSYSVKEILMWASSTFRDSLVLQSSFGIRSAAFLHMVVEVVPNIPVILVDTGYLPQETLDFAVDLQKRLGLNLKVYRSNMSVEEMERVYGRLYETKEKWAHELYGRLRKVEPMERALKDLGATAVLTGLRASQTNFRKNMCMLNQTRQGL